MLLRYAICRLTLVVMCSLSFLGSALAQTSPSGTAPNGAELASSTEVSVAMEIFDRLATKIRLTFRPKGEVKDPILAIAGFDIAVEHREVGDLAKDLKQSGTSGLAVVVDSGSPREVWFGKILEPGQRSAELSFELPGFIKPKEATKNYALQFLAVAGNPKWLTGASRTISLAKLSDVTLKLPEGWQVLDKNWKVNSFVDNEFGYKGSLANGDAIEAQLVRPALAVQEWFQEHIAQFFTVFLIVLVVLVAVIKLLLQNGWRQLVAKAAILAFMLLLVAYVAYDRYEGGSHGWFERNWWLISSITAAILAIILPVSLVSFLLDALKNNEPAEGAGT
jgi:hypothetical protein